MITRLGQDGFGDKIVSELNRYGVDTSMIARAPARPIPRSLFVALQPDGDREFSFTAIPARTC